MGQVENETEEGKDSAKIVNANLYKTEKETHVRRYSGGPLILALTFHPKRAFPFYVWSVRCSSTCLTK